jgi:hypothetical protein
MAFRVNYNQQRGDRDRAKAQKKKERLERREEDAKKRKAERDDFLRGPLPEGEAPAGDPEENK